LIFVYVLLLFCVVVFFWGWGLMFSLVPFLSPSCIQSNVSNTPYTRSNTRGVGRHSRHVLINREYNS